MVKYTLIIDYGQFKISEIMPMLLTYIFLYSFPFSCIYLLVLFYPTHPF